MSGRWIVSFDSNYFGKLFNGKALYDIGDPKNTEKTVAKYNKYSFQTWNSGDNSDKMTAEQKDEFFMWLVHNFLKNVMGDTNYANELVLFMRGEKSLIGVENGVGTANDIAHILRVIENKYDMWVKKIEYRQKGLKMPKEEEKALGEKENKNTEVREKNENMIRMGELQKRVKKYVGKKDGKRKRLDEKFRKYLEDKGMEVGLMVKKKRPSKKQKRVYEPVDNSDDEEEDSEDEGSSERQRKEEEERRVRNLMEQVTDVVAA